MARPGMPVNPIAKHMLPSPPDLAVAMRPWKERELFWIVKHGFKYTGMPGWVAIERDDEIWAVVAFLKRLPTLNAESYRELALGDVRVSPHSGSELATSESNPEAISACARCHGSEGQRPMSNLVPVLHGQSADYVFSALKAYAEGRRHSGIMQPLAADLREEDMRNLADYYAGLTPPRGEPEAADTHLIDRGRKLALQGAPDCGIPPCMACHGNPGSAPAPWRPTCCLSRGPTKALANGAWPSNRRRSSHGSCCPTFERRSDRCRFGISEYRPSANA